MTNDPTPNTHDAAETPKTLEELLTTYRNTGLDYDKHDELLAEIKSRVNSMKFIKSTPSQLAETYREKTNRVVNQMFHPAIDKAETRTISIAELNRLLDATHAEGIRKGEIICGMFGHDIKTSEVKSTTPPSEIPGETEYCYGESDVPEGHVIKHLEAPVCNFTEMCNFILESVNVTNTTLWIYNKNRGLTQRLLFAAYRDAIARIRENQAKNAPGYNKFDAGATIHTLRLKFTKTKALISQEYRKQFRALKSTTPPTPAVPSEPTKTIITAKEFSRLTGKKATNDVVLIDNGDGSGSIEDYHPAVPDLDECPQCGTLIGADDKDCEQCERDRQAAPSVAPTDHGRLHGSEAAWRACEVCNARLNKKPGTMKGYDKLQNQISKVPQAVEIIQRFSTPERKKMPRKK